MPHIHNGPGEHDQTASAFIVKLDGDQPKVLIHTHKKLGILLQPGGHVELHENPWQAILHEIREETGYDTAQLKVLQPKERIRTISIAAMLHPIAVCQNTHLFSSSLDHYHTDTSYAFVTSDLPTHDPESGESTIFHWMTAADIESVDTKNMPDNVRHIALYVLRQCLETWEAVSLDDFAH